MKFFIDASKEFKAGKNQNVLDVNNKEYDYQMGVHYMDIITECEKLGDYVVNVVEAGSNVKEKKA